MIQFYLEESRTIIYLQVKIRANYGHGFEI